MALMDAVRKGNRDEIESEIKAIDSDMAARHIMGCGLNARQMDMLRLSPWARANQDKEGK